MLRILFTCLCALLLLSATAQHDGETWKGISVGYKINKKMRAEGALQARVNGWGSNLKTVFGQASVSYKYNKYVRLKGNYRYGSRNSIRGFGGYRHRTNVDVSLRKRKKPFTYSLRARYQVEYDNLYQTEIATVIDHTVRIKPKVSYRIDKRNDLALSTELFRTVRNPAVTRFDAFRVGLGLAKDLKDGRSLTLGYKWEQGINTPAPRTTHIFAVEYGFSL